MLRLTTHIHPLCLTRVGVVESIPAVARWEAGTHPGWITSPPQDTQFTHTLEQSKVPDQPNLLIDWHQAKTRVKPSTFWLCCSHDAPQFQRIQQLTSSNTTIFIWSSKLKTSNWIFKTWKSTLKIRFWLIARLCLAQSPLCGMTQLLAKIDKACFPCRSNQPHQDFYCCGKKWDIMTIFIPCSPK